MRRYTPILLVALATLTLAACGGAGSHGNGGSTATAVLAPVTTDSADPGEGPFPAAESPIKGGRLKMASTDDIDTWNGLSYDTTSYSLFAFLARGLYGYANTTALPDSDTVRPDLAADLPQISADGLTYTVRLREGLRFPDGSPVGATDVKATFEYMLDPNLAPGTGGPSGSGYYDVIAGVPEYAATLRDSNGKTEATISGITVVDDLTVRFQLTRADGSFLRVLAMPWAFVRPASTPHKITNVPPPYIGPYRVTDYQAAKSLTIDREPSWAGNVAAGVPEERDEDNLDGVDLEIGVTADTQLLRLKNNDLDVSFDSSAPSGSDIPAVAADPALRDRFFSAPAAGVTYGFFRTDKPPFDDVRLRQAVNQAIDRRALEKAVGGALRATAWTQILSENLLGSEPTDVYPVSPDVDAAKELIAASGVATPIRVTLAVPSDPVAATVAQAVKESLDTVGFDVNLKEVAFDVYFGYVADQASPYHMGSVGWGQDFPDAITFFGPLLTCPEGEPTGANFGRYCDAAFDAKVAEVNRLPVGPDRTAAFAKLSTDTMRTAAPWWPISNDRKALLISDRVGNFAWGPTKQFYLARYFIRG